MAYAPRSPDFIVIGAQKAGTSWLWANLREHPGIWCPDEKEIHFFDRWESDDSSQLDEEWYRSIFAPAPPDSLVGEATPKYAICKESTIAFMRRVAPEAKLILSLRHPVDRFWSQWLMKMSYAGLVPSEETAIEFEQAAIDFFQTELGRPRGEYLASIERFASVFGPERLLVVFYDAIALQPLALMKGIYEFLNLPTPPPNWTMLSQLVNPSTYSPPMPDRLRRHVSEAYRLEMARMATIFKGYAADWVSCERAQIDQPAFVRITSQLLSELNAYGS